MGLKAGFGCLLLPALVISPPYRDPTQRKKYGVVLMFKLITVATGQAMREIDLNSLYVLPPYHAYDQSTHPKRSRSVGMQLMKLFFFLDGGGLAEDFPGSIIWWNPPCQIHKSPEEDNVLLSIEE